MAGAALPSREMVAAAAQLGFPPRPGIRFYPTDQELVGWFLRSKVLGHAGLHIHFIPVVNAYKFEPQELPGTHARTPAHEYNLELPGIFAPLYK